MRARVAFVFAALLVACGDKAPSTVSGAPSVPPDDQFETAGRTTYRVLVWNHTSANERVVMYQSCGARFFGCAPWQVERTLWPGSTTPIESTLSRLSRHPIPPGDGWR